jgi:hypothetical protein
MYSTAARLIWRSCILCYKAYHVHQENSHIIVSPSFESSSTPRKPKKSRARPFAPIHQVEVVALIHVSHLVPIVDSLFDSEDGYIANGMEWHETRWRTILGTMSNTKGVAERESRTTRGRGGVPSEALNLLYIPSKVDVVLLKGTIGSLYPSKTSRYSSTQAVSVFLCFARVASRNYPKNFECHGVC